MNWPWISRDAHNVAIAAERARANAEHENAQALRRENADLLAKYHALKLQGAVIVEPSAVSHGPQVIVHPTPDPVRTAIREQVRANPDMRGLDSYLTKYAAELRDNHNLSPKEIIAKLLRWDSSETLSEPVDPIMAVDISEDAA